jgi:DNA ligase (NAD+)
MSRRLARFYGNMDALRHADLESLQQVEAVGPDRAAAIRDDLDELSDVLNELTVLGIGQIEQNDNSGPTPLAGMTVVVTGSMSGPLADLSRQQMKDLIERLGGRASDSVSAKTSLLVSTETNSSKAKKAAELGVRTVGPDQFYAEYVAVPSEAE